MRVAFYRADYQKILVCPLIKRLGQAFFLFKTCSRAFETLSWAFETLGSDLRIWLEHSLDTCAIDGGLISYGWSNVAKFNEILYVFNWVIILIRRNIYMFNKIIILIQRNNSLYIQRIIYIFNEIIIHIFNEVIIFN